MSIHYSVTDTEKLVTITAEENIEFAANLMKQNQVGTLVVVKGTGKRLIAIGLLTDRDIVIKGVAEKRDLSATTVGEIMSLNPVQMRKDELIAEGIGQMVKKHARCALIKDDEGFVCGLISCDKIIQMLGDQLSDITEVFRAQAGDLTDKG